MMNGGAVPQHAHLISYTHILCNGGATLLSHYHHHCYYQATIPLVPQGAELCNLRADKSRFGEILEAEILLKLPVLLLWKSQQLELPWDWIRMDIEPEKLLSGSCSAHSGPQHIHTHSQIVLLNGR